MKSTSFQWDKFAQKASYDEVRHLQVHTGRLPSMFNPERTEIYLSSMDYSVRVDDVDGLKSIGEEIASYLQSFSTASLADQRKIVDLRTDHGAIGNLLHDLGEQLQPLPL
ncbi:hypothetical protein VSO52_11315 [Pseudomonas fulva]|uniref:hypothetical protein n=1 Tax=Pseudomonas fulva TaxID=47880 RepID=UPI002DB96187|nr:hypothetical protein [Pseudomonas fulva]MEC4023367.1 hypothetical protein [Pseudomonas fulva]